MRNELPIRIPQEFVNDDTVILLRWLVEEGGAVREGMSLLEVETSKAVVEIAATASGILQQQIKKAAAEVRVGDIVGYISSNGRSAVMTGVALMSPHSKEDAKLPSDEIAPGPRFSNKAMELLQTKGVSLAIFAGRSMVREQDVLDFLTHSVESTPPNATVPRALNGISLEGVSLPSSMRDPQAGEIDASFLAQLRNDPDTFASLTPSEKCDAYRKHGAVIGDKVILAIGCVVIAPRIVLGDHVQLGPSSNLQCREQISIGKLSSFRRGLSVRGGSVVLGENIFAGANITIGGGGNGDPDSYLAVGNGTYIGDDVFINICRPVLIGKEVFLTQRAVLVTHNIGHSVLEGYENRFAGIVLEDYAQVGMSSTIYAGSRIGRGSVVMSNSYVVSSIPPDKLAAGVPARVIREATRPIDRKRQLEIVHEMMFAYRDLLERKGYLVSSLVRESSPTFTVHWNEKRFQLTFLEKFPNRSSRSEETDESVVWTFDGSGLPSCENEVQIDLLAKTITGPGGVFTETTREFLRKRGIRLEPGPWRYPGGLI